MPERTGRTLTLRRPDDAHLHLRDGEALAAVVGATAAQFARAVVMPNLRPPVRTAADAQAYRARIVAALPAAAAFEPLMTLYLTEQTDPNAMAAAKAAGVFGCKLYPAGATTNSDAGVREIARVDEVLAAMAEAGLPLLIHGEVTDEEVDVFDREAVFVERTLAPLVARHPRLRVVLEHVTSATGVAFVASAREGVAATLTAHHLLIDRNAMLVGGIRPHLYCLPILKTRADREALLQAATSGSPRFMLGTDSAPHEVGRKESECGCAGSYTAPVALQLYAEAFESVGRLDRLEAFASAHFADFHGLPRNEGTVTLVEEEVAVPSALPFGDGADGPLRVRPFRAGESVRWRVSYGV
ncbi:MAG: dihydroorotase [Deltaproteobacteria bacterium]|nr:dihydroorotase [Deltaproteobacteria bacterium]